MLYAAATFSLVRPMGSKHASPVLPSCDQKSRTSHEAQGVPCNVSVFPQLVQAILRQRKIQIYKSETNQFRPEIQPKLAFHAQEVVHFSLQFTDLPILISKNLTSATPHFFTSSIHGSSTEPQHLYSPGP